MDKQQKLVTAACSRKCDSQTLNIELTNPEMERSEFLF